MLELLRAPKNAFRQANDRPGKAQRHRYERRKSKAYLNLQNLQGWLEQSET